MLTAGVYDDPPTQAANCAVPPEEAHDCVYRRRVQRGER
jgi:hypothetical protein